MQNVDLFVAVNKEAGKIKQGMGLQLNKPVPISSSARSISPTKAGNIYGTFTPSPTKTIKVRRVGGIIDNVLLTRHERRILARRMAKYG